MNNLLSDKIIVDVDTGIDDALAILLLANKASDRILWFTTCGGNVGVSQTTKNTLAVLELIGSNVPVYKGSDKNLAGEGYIFAYDYHGRNGICNVELTNSRTVSGDAMSFMKKSIDENGGQISFLCLAPPTNLAKTLKESPELVKKINSVVLMGGALKVSGNQTEKAEFNFFQDPLAVDIILKSVKNVYIVPLDITNRCLIAEQDINDISSNSAQVKFFKQAIENWYEFFGRPKNRSFELYDPLAAAAVCSDVLKFERERIDVVMSGQNRGALISGGKTEVSLATDCDEIEFMEMFYGAFKK
ncbi:MAG: nucleoside hydrolase [Candidatus Berkelbacteria bacterium]|nr:nucleoside hydrolase [Candidatus Berkelbacteria bacterium]